MSVEGENHGDKSQFLRRSFLKAGGVMLGTVLLGGPSIAKRGQSNGRIQDDFRGFNNPITFDEIQENRNIAYQFYLQVGGEPKNVLGWSEHATTDDGAIVAHVVGFDAKSGLREFIGVAGNPRNVSSAHQEAKEFEQFLATELEQSPLVTGEKAATKPYWETIDDSVVTYNHCPEGKVRVDYMEKYLQNDGDRNLDNIAIRQNTQIMPGNLPTTCGSDTKRETRDVWMEQNWSKYDSFHQLEKDGPESATGVNSYSVNLSLQDAGFQWSHAESAAAVKNRSDTTTGHMRWDVDVGSGARDVKLEHQPGSTASYDPGDQKSVKLLDLLQKANFRVETDICCKRTVGGSFVLGVNYGGGPSPYE